MRRIKFLNREQTNLILVIEKDLEEKDFESLFREARKRGDFDVDFHILVHRDGTVEEGRKIDAVGGLSIREEEDAVIVFVDIADEENAFQHNALTELIEHLQEKYPDAIVQKIVE